MSVVAIIPSAGLGRRMGSSTPKAYVEIAGKPLLAHTLDRFAAARSVDAVVVVVPAGEIEATRTLIRTHYPKVMQVVPGGAERQDSVAAGFAAVSSLAEIVLVHDGVRPFVPPELIDRSVAAAREFGAAILAWPVSDTIKEADEEGRILRTVDRNRLWGAQTPQAFRYEVLREALARAAADRFYGTDEAGLVERLGRPVHLVKGSKLNIKITTPEDLILAEAIARHMSF